MFKKNKDLMLFGLNANQSTLRGLYLFLAVYLGASLFASVLTGPIYSLVEYMDKIEVSWLDTKWLLGKGADVFYDRLRWIGIVFTLPVVLKKCGLFSLKNLGISFNINSLKIFLKYFLVGTALAWSIYSLQIYFLGVSLNEGLTFDTVASVLINAILGALVLGFLEELIFRGLIFRTIYTAFGVWIAIIFSSAFFAYKHFKVDSGIFSNIVMEKSSWDIGFYVFYYDTIGILYNFNFLMFANLMLFGMVLSLMYMLKRTLLVPMGFHSGLVASMILFRGITNSNTSGKYSPIYGSADMVNGYVSLVLLSLIFVFMVYYGYKKDRTT